MSTSTIFDKALVESVKSLYPTIVEYALNCDVELALKAIDQYREMVFNTNLVVTETHFDDYRDPFLDYFVSQLRYNPESSVSINELYKKYLATLFSSPSRKWFIDRLLQFLNDYKLTKIRLENGFLVGLEWR